MTMQNGAKKFDLAAFVIATCLFFRMPPFFLWKMSHIVQFGLIPTAYLIAIVPNMDLKKRFNIPLFIMFFGLFLFATLNIGYNFSFTISILSIAVVPFLKQDKLQTTLKYFEIILAVFFAGGLLFYALLLIGIPLPGHYIAPLNEEKIMGYTAYPPFCVVANGYYNVFRFFGPFDEPGVVGTLSTFILYIENYNLRKPRILIIFIAAFFSWSFFFFTGSLLYVVFRFVKKASTSIVLILLLLGTYSVTKDIPVFQEAIYKRFEWDAESGKFMGDNRYGDAQKEYVESIKGTRDYFWGDHGKSAGDFEGARSYLDAIIKYGFIFCLMYLLWFILYARSYYLSWYSVFVFMAILLLNLYQRPNFISFTYVFVYTCCIRNWSDKQDILLSTNKL